MANIPEPPQRKGRALPPLSTKSNSQDNFDLRTKNKRNKALRKLDDVIGESEDDNKNLNNSLNSQIATNKKARKKEKGGGSRQALVSDEEFDTEKVQKKKKKRKKAPDRKEDQASNVLGLESEINGIADDIVNPEDYYGGSSGNVRNIDESAYQIGPTLKSETVPKVFVEKEGGFKMKDKNALQRKRAVKEAEKQVVSVGPPVYTTKQVAVVSHKGFKTSSIFLQGMFGGIALWHIVSVWTIANVSIDTFLEYYSKLALPVSCMYYLLFAINCVAVFDRYDIGHPTRKVFLQCITLQSGYIVCFIYFIGLVFSLSITHIDDRIGMNDMEEWEDSIDVRDKEINRWLILNLMRGLMAILGWFVISLRPQTDKLLHALEKEDDLLFEEFQNSVIEERNKEMNA